MSSYVLKEYYRESEVRALDVWGIKQCSPRLHCFSKDIRRGPSKQASNRRQGILYGRETGTNAETAGTYTSERIFRHSEAALLRFRPNGGAGDATETVIFLHRFGVCVARILVIIYFIPLSDSEV